MFAVIYRGYLKPGSEKDYIKHWKLIASYFVHARGALGSTLHKTEDGMWIAYSKWPSKEMRDLSWPQNNQPIHPDYPREIQEAIAGLKECLDQDKRLPEIQMEVLEEIAAVSTSV